MNGLPELMAQSRVPGIAANSLLLQPAARYFRINDAFELLDGTNNDVALAQAIQQTDQTVAGLQTALDQANQNIANLQSEIATLQGQVAAVTATANANTSAIATINQRLANAGIP